MLSFSEKLTCRVPDAAAAVGLGLTKMWQLIKAGRVETRKIDGRRVVVVKSLQALVDATPVKGDAGPSPKAARAISARAASRAKAKAAADVKTKRRRRQLARASNAAVA